MNKEDTLSGVLGLLDRTDDFIRNSATVKILSVGILIAFNVIFLPVKKVRVIA